MNGLIISIISKHLRTSKSAFEEKVSEARNRPFLQVVKRFRRSATRYKAQQIVGKLSSEIHGADEKFVIEMHGTELFARLHTSNAQNNKDEIHDILKAYYEIARENFSECISQHAVETYISDAADPVQNFSPAFVASLGDEAIENLASEDETLMRNRTTY